MMKRVLLLFWVCSSVAASWESPSWSFVTTAARCEGHNGPCWGGFGKTVHFYSSATCRELCVLDASPEQYRCGPCPTSTEVVSVDQQVRASKMRIQAFSEGVVMPDGLWLTRYAFGPEISAKGTSSLLVHKGFIFVTHYSGGMDRRFVGISRKRIADKETNWQTIIFPHQHSFFRRDQNLPEHERRGDSHNVIALGISPIDDSMDFPDDYFNYQYTGPGAALVSDEFFESALFSPKQTFLNPQANESMYYRATYPSFFVSGDHFFLTWRKGGSTSAEMVFHRYESSTQSWSNPWFWNTQTPDTRTGIYGEYRQQQDQIYFVWQRRKPSDADAGYRINRGLYLAYSDAVEGQWRSPSGTVELELPIRNLESFRLGDPSLPGESMVTGGGGATLPYLISPDGSFHALLRVDGMQRHCYKSSLDSRLVISNNEVKWSSADIFYVRQRVFRIGLKDDRPIIQSTEPGTDAWQDEYRAQSGLIFTHGVSTLVGETTLYFYLMQRKPVTSDQRPLHVLRFEVE